MNTNYDIVIKLYNSLKDQVGENNLKDPNKIDEISKKVLFVSNNSLHRDLSSLEFKKKPLGWNFFLNLRRFFGINNSAEYQLRSNIKIFQDSISALPQEKEVVALNRIVTHLGKSLKPVDIHVVALHPEDIERVKTVCASHEGINLITHVNNTYGIPASANVIYAVPIPDDNVRGRSYDFTSKATSYYQLSQDVSKLKSKNIFICYLSKTITDDKVRDKEREIEDVLTNQPSMSRSWDEGKAFILPPSGTIQSDILQKLKTPPLEKNSALSSLVNKIIRGLFSRTV